MRRRRGIYRGLVSWTLYHFCCFHVTIVGFADLGSATGHMAHVGGAAFGALYYLLALRGRYRPARVGMR